MKNFNKVITFFAYHSSPSAIFLKKLFCMYIQRKFYLRIMKFHFQINYNNYEKMKMQSLKFNRRVII